MSKTKEIGCPGCGEIFTTSLYSNPKTTKCTKCRGGKVSVVKRETQPKTTNSNKDKFELEMLRSRVEELEEMNGIGQVGKFSEALLGTTTDSKPVKVQLLRNRQEIEACIIMDTGEVFERVQTEYKSRENQLDYLSVSKIDTYQRCPAKFFRQYMSNEGIAEDGGNIFTWFGSILHEVVEMADKYYAQSGIMVNPMSIYDEAWKKRQLADLGMYKEGKALIEDYFMRNKIGIRKLLGVEVEWRGELGGTTFGLMIDNVSEVSHDTAMIMDYKTNRQPYMRSDLENSLQLGVYELVCRKFLYPQYKNWITGYELFRFGWQQCPPRSEEELNEIESFIGIIATQIKNDNTWEEKLNTFCGYCPFQYTCKKYQDFVSNPERHIESIITDSTDLSVLDKSRDMLTVYEKIAKDRKDKIADMIKFMIEKCAKEGRSLVIDGNELGLCSQQQSSYNYFSTKQVLTVCGKSDILDDCISINKTKLDKVLKSDPQLQLALSQCMETSYKSPYIVKKKYKGK